MKLLVIVLCLLSERFFMHRNSNNRIQWFNAYFNKFNFTGFNKPFYTYPWIILILFLLPLLLLTFIIFYLFENWLFGFVGLILHIVIFHACIGPSNPFYPTVTNASKKNISEYFYQVNGQLFAVIFWYLVSGPIGILAYRLISYSQTRDVIKNPATKLTDLLDWIPARLTAFLYLLVGNFQAGYTSFLAFFFTKPANNQSLLSVCGIKSAELGSAAEHITQAEVLVEHAVILYLVFIALFTMFAWL